MKLRFLIFILETVSKQWQIKDQMILKVWWKCGLDSEGSQLMVVSCLWMVLLVFGYMVCVPLREHNRWHNTHGCHSAATGAPHTHAQTHMPTWYASLSRSKCLSVFRGKSVVNNLTGKEGNLTTFLHHFLGDKFLHFFSLKEHFIHKWCHTVVWAWMLGHLR